MDFLDDIWDGHVDEDSGSDHSSLPPDLVQSESEPEDLELEADDLASMLSDESDDESDAPDETVCLPNKRDKHPPRVAPPSKRSKLEHAYVCSRMREALARKRLKCKSIKQASVLSTYVEKVNAAPVRRGHELQVKKNKTCFGLQLLVRQTKPTRGRVAKGRKFLLSWVSMASLAFGCVTARRALSETYMVAQRTVRRVVEIVAHVSLLYQACLLQRLSEMLEKTKPDVAALSIMWDETSEKLSLPAVQGANAATSSSNWEVCVSRFDFCIGVGGRFFTFLCVTPPIPMISNGSASIFRSLFSHPLMEPIIKFRKLLAEIAGIFIEVNEADGHPANDKLFHGRLQLAMAMAHAQRPSYMQLHWCNNHATNLVNVSLVAVGDAAGLINTMFIAGKFMRMGGHFVRLIASVRGVVEENLVWVRKPPHGEVEQHAPYWEALGSFLIDNFERGAYAYVNRQGRGRTEYVNNVRLACGKIFNGRPGSCTPLMHLETGLHRTREEVVKNFTWAIISCCCLTCRCSRSSASGPSSAPRLIFGWWHVCTAC